MQFNVSYFLTALKEFEIMGGKLLLQIFHIHSCNCFETMMFDVYRFKRNYVKYII